VVGVTGLLFFAGWLGSLAAETLGDALRAANVPTRQFAAPELSGPITSYAVSTTIHFSLLIT